jgi:hypothetical protein
VLNITVYWSFNLTLLQWQIEASLCPSVANGQAQTLRLACDMQKYSHKRENMSYWWDLVCMANFLPSCAFICARTKYVCHARPPRQRLFSSSARTSQRPHLFHAHDVRASIALRVDEFSTCNLIELLSSWRILVATLWVVDKLRSSNSATSTYDMDTRRQTDHHKDCDLILNGI